MILFKILFFLILLFCIDLKAKACHQDIIFSVIENFVLTSSIRQQNEKYTLTYM